MTRPGLVSIPRHELVAAALSLGIPEPESMSSEELTASIQRASETGEVAASASNGWFEVARHLVASVMGQGLNMPEAARLILGPKSAPKQRPPLPTVTLAQIYLSQGHTARAKSTLSLVLAREPHNTKARRLLDGISDAEPVSSGANPQSSSPKQAQDSTPEPERAQEPLRARASSLAPRGAALQEDTAVVIRDGERVIVCWELGERTALEIETDSLKLVLTQVRPRWEGAEAELEEHPVAAARGQYEFSCDASVVVRAAIATTRGGQLRALSVASTQEVTDGSLNVLFSPRPNCDDSAVAERAWTRLRSA